MNDSIFYKISDRAPEFASGKKTWLYSTEVGWEHLRNQITYAFARERRHYTHWCYDDTLPKVAPEVESFGACGRIADVEKLADEVFCYAHQQGVMMDRKRHTDNIAAILTREFSKRSNVARETCRQAWTDAHEANARAERAEAELVEVKQNLAIASANSRRNGAMADSLSLEVREAVSERDQLRVELIKLHNNVAAKDAEIARAKEIIAGFKDALKEDTLTARAEHAETALATFRYKLAEARSHIEIATHPELGWAVDSKEYNRVVAERDKYWKQICDTVEAMGKMISPDAALHSVDWAKSLKEEADQLRATIEATRAKENKP